MARNGRLDIIAGLLGLLAALALLPVQLFLDDVYVRTLPVVLLVASLLYLIAARSEFPGELPVLSARMSRLLPSLIVVGCAVLLALAGLMGSRGMVFYYIATVVGAGLLVLILFVDEEYFSPTLLLFLIILFGVVIRFSALYTTPGYIGIDIWSHAADWSTAIRDAGSLAPIEGRKYFAAPLYHLLVVGSSLLLDVPVKTALYLVLGIAMPLSVVLIYSTATFFVEKRWAVFATAVYAMSATVIEWGIHIIPTSLGLVFFLAIFYALDRMLRIDYRPRDFLLVVFFSVAVILTHQISSFIMVVFTGSGLIAYFLISLGVFDIGQGTWKRSSTRESVNLTGLMVFDLGLMTFMWSLTPQSGDTFLVVMMTYLEEALETGDTGTVSQGNIPESVLPAPTMMDTLVEYLDVLGFLLVLMLTIVGCYYIIRQENISHATFTAVVATVSMLVFVFVFPMLGIRTFVPGRWFPFVAAPMAVIGAIGLAYLVDNTNPSIVLTVLLVFILIFPAASMFSSDSTLESPPFEGTQPRYSYTNAELAAVDAMEQYTAPRDENNTKYWATDHPYQTVFDRTLYWRSISATEGHGVPIGLYDNNNGFVSGRVGQNNAGLEVKNNSDGFIYREYEQSGATVFQLLYNHTSTGQSPEVRREQVCGGSRDVVYTNGEVTVCTQPGA